MPRWFYKLPLRLRSLFRRERVEEELSDELRFHLEKLIEENAAKGMSAEEARYAALRELGGVEQIKEECRDTRRVSYIENFLQDVRYSLRMLAKKPGFTAVAVLTLALGIGANTAIFSVVNAVLLRPLTFKDPDRLVKIWLTAPQYGLPLAYVNPPSYLTWQKENTLFEDMAANTEVMASPTVLTGNGNPETVIAQRVFANYFAVLGVQPLMGRTFLAEEDRPGKDSVALLSYDLWRRRFADDPNVLGKPLTVNDESFTIIGVMPPACAPSSRPEDASPSSFGCPILSGTAG
jgi:hypothetical protein